MINVEKVKPTGLFTNYIYKAIPLAFDESMSYYETLCGLLSYLKDTIIPTLNNNADAIVEVQNLMTQLQNYVDNYFENLDVQQEINNKLDEMAESGELTDIIAQYLELAGVLAYNNITELKNAENITNGSICKTLGFNTLNDGGGAFYKIRTITNQDTIDEYSIIAIINDNSLVAELINTHEMTLETFGCVGDGTTDDSTKLKNALLYCKNNKIKLTTNGKEYYINDDITIDHEYFDLNNATLKMNNHNITLTNISIFTNGIIKNGNIILDGGRNLLSYITFKEFNGVAITINSNGYEDFIEYIRIENNSNSTDTVGILNNSGDETIKDVYGFGCYKGIITKGADNYYENIHLWLNNNNTFEDSIFVQLDSTSNVFTNCCSDSYHKPIYLGATYLKNTFTNFNFINNNILFKNKNFVLVSGTTTNCVLNGNVICKLTNFDTPENNNTLAIGYGSHLYFEFIDGGATEKTGAFNYTWIQSKTTGANVTINEVSSIYLNNSELNINLTMYISGRDTSSISIDLSSLLGINNFKSRGFVSAIYDNYTKVGAVEYYLNNGTLTFSKPNQETGATFSAIGLNLLIRQ